MTTKTDPGRETRGQIARRDAETTVPVDGAPPEPRYCRFAAIFCRCGLVGLESSTMTVCAMHYLDEIEAAS